jgi:hypothetical protein
MTDKPTTAQELEELLGRVNWDKVFKDELTAEVKKQLDYNMSIILNGTPGEVMKYNRPMNIFEKLQAGWWWFGECFDEWCWTMTHDDGEFFNYIQSDYVKYEEDMYYETY